MKRIVSIALVVVLVFALAATAAALPSPQGKSYYKISVDAEGSGDVDASKSKVVKNSDDTVTLTATDADGFFTLWMIDGEYTIVDGDLNSPVITILPLSDIKATASFSQEEDWLVITTEVVGDGTASANPARVKKGSGDTVVLTAVDGEDEFSFWELQCQYDIVKGDLKSRELVIRPYTDIHAIATFVNSDQKDDSKKDEPKKDNTNDDDTSPKTGDPLYVVLTMMALALGFAVVAGKKIKE